MITNVLNYVFIVFLVMARKRVPFFDDKFLTFTRIYLNSNAR